jgi:opacity protein-like surface antigen
MKLKNLLLLTTLLSNNAMAETDGFYAKLKMSRHHPDNIKEMVGKPVILPGFAIGYNFNDNTRVDLSIEHFSDIKHTALVDGNHPVHSHIHSVATCSSTPYAPPPYDAVHPAALQQPLKALCTHAKITTAKVNLFIDLVKIKKRSLFVGAGIGTAKISGAVTIDTTIKKIKPSYTLAYDLHLGIAQKILDDISLEVGYTYHHLTDQIYNYKGHSLVSSIRIDL